MKWDKYKEHLHLKSLSLVDDIGERLKRSTMSERNQWLEGIGREANIPLQSLGLQVQMSYILNCTFCLPVIYLAPQNRLFRLSRSGKSCEKNRKNLQMMAWSYHCSSDTLLKSNSSLKAQFLI